MYGDSKQRQSLNLFRMSRAPVTNSQYKAFVDATHREPPSHWANGLMPADKENHPVVNVSWDDAQAFCQWAGVRLPTEQQWEKAARGTDGRAYPWGNQPPSGDLCNFNNIVGGTTPVGHYPKGASPYGLLDMAGNVFEWCENLYEGQSNVRVIRGGAYNMDASWVGCAYRYGLNQNYRLENRGFRVVRP
ncbi:MAG: SUMF1/EgtB/PvdO family nonheme iron enzyme [Anaerolineae bacterium]|nr:SUMF1/EgtB/PvdO family nonheme iron enzyme [Anaerolineae bacterium]